MNVALAKTDTGNALDAAFAAARERLPAAGNVAEIRRQALEAYERDLRQCLVFLSGHWGGPVTLRQFGKLETADIRAFMAMRRADDIGGTSRGSRS